MRSKISTGELERRWRAVRQAMKDQRLDFIIFQNSTAHLCGYVKWFTDMFVGQGYPATVIFPLDDEMTTIWHGPRPPEEPVPPAGSLRGVKKRISVPVLPSLGYSSIFDAEKAVEELAPYRNCRVGLVGMGFISAAFYKYVTGHLDTVTFEDATDLVENIKAIKSDEEIDLIKETCQIQDAVFEYVLTRVKPGRRDQEVRSEAIHRCLDLGVEEAFVRVGSAPAGTSAVKSGVSRTIEDGDQFSISLETDGPSGFWAEMGRAICLGKVSAELEEHNEIAKQAQKVTVDLLKPGADPAALWEANNEFLRSRGYPEECRIYAHGQGYDMVERPSLDAYEPMKVQARMNMAVHPVVKSARARGAVGQNFLVTEDRGAISLHHTPQKIFVI